MIFREIYQSPLQAKHIEKLHLVGDDKMWNFNSSDEAIIPK